MLEKWAELMSDHLCDLIDLFLTVFSDPMTNVANLVSLIKMKYSAKIVQSYIIL